MNLRNNFRLVLFAFFLLSISKSMLTAQQAATDPPPLLEPPQVTTDYPPEPDLNPDPEDVFWDPRFSTSGPNARVFAMAIDGDDVYVSGQFSGAGGVAAPGIAKWDGSSWSALGTGVNGWVTTIEIHNGDVYVGGGFQYAGGVLCNHIARWDGSQWHPSLRGGEFLRGGLGLRKWSCQMGRHKLVFSGDMVQGLVTFNDRCRE